jgi:hypothetical protein
VNVKIKIGLALQSFCANREIVEANGGTIRACLTDLVHKFPDLGPWLFDRNGIPMVLILQQNMVISAADLDRPVHEGEQLEIILIIGGG